jgi:gluconolactonase
MHVEIRDDRFVEVAGRDIEIEKLVTGFLFVEGPIWNPNDESLIFSDIPANTMFKWTSQEGVSTFRKPSNYSNGNTYDLQGRVLTCEHSTSTVTRSDAPGNREVIASHYGDAELNSPNDIVVRSDGSIYFTDPDYGRYPDIGGPRDKELDFQGVYRVRPSDNSLELLVRDFDQPNGLCFSPDEKILYVDDTRRGHIRSFPLHSDGSLGEGSLFAELTGDGAGVPDGMRCDTAGNLYCTGPGGIHVVDPAGNTLGVIRIPEIVANLAFGGDDYRQVFATASTSIYRFSVKVPGIPQFNPR